MSADIMAPDRLEQLDSQWTRPTADPTLYRYAIVSAGHVGTLEEIVRDHIRAGWQCQGGIALGQDGCHQAMVRP